METGKDIDVKDLPAAIVSYIKEHYNGVTIKEAASVKTPNGDRLEAETNGVKKICSLMRMENS